MQRIVILNTKGGCGKSTLATNLAAAVATRGERVTLADLDPQRSATDWLARRPTQLPAITGVACDIGELLIPLGANDWLIFDTSAALHAKDLKAHLKLASTILIPLQPSAIDLRAAQRLMADLAQMGRVRKERVQLALVLMRVKYQSRAWRDLQSEIAALNLPLAATLRESCNYLYAAASGLGVMELPSRQAARDRSEWQSLLSVLESNA
jgi:chromosome partitioning protein